MNTRVYLHRSFADVVNLLTRLRVIGIATHKVSHATMMVAMQNGNPTVTIPSHWVPLPIIDLSQEYAEFIPYRRRGV